MSNKFTAVYDIHKYADGDDGDFGYELLSLDSIFEHYAGEEAFIDEYTRTYYHITHSTLKDQPEGMYRVYIQGVITYHTDYWGEVDVNIEVGYESFKAYEPNEYESLNGEETDEMFTLEN